MTDKEKYKQAFGVLHASGVTITEDFMEKKSNKTIVRIVAVCLCAVLLTAGAVTVHAFEEEIIRCIKGWSNNMEIIEDRNGSSIRVNTDELDSPISVEDGRAYFIVNDEHIDITDKMSETEPYCYDYEDADGNTHYWIVGPVGDGKQYGYGEFIQSPDGELLGGYSAGVNIEADGTVDSEWLRVGKEKLSIP